MSTSAIIMRNLDDSNMEVIYCHNNGRPSQLGRILYKVYNKQEKVDALFSLGDCCYIGPLLEPDCEAGEHDFWSPQPNVTVAFCRDAGEPEFTGHHRYSIGSGQFQTMKDVMEHCAGIASASYGYFWDKNTSRWYLDYGISEPKNITDKRLDEWAETENKTEEICIKGKYFSASNSEEPERLKLYDSNGNYMDYVDTELADAAFLSELEKASNVVNGRTLMFLYDHFDVAGFINITMSDTSIEELKEEYGDEYINVIGNIAVIMQEA